MNTKDVSFLETEDEFWYTAGQCCKFAHNANNILLCKDCNKTVDLLKEALTENRDADFMKMVALCVEFYYEEGLKEVNTYLLLKGFNSR